MERSTPAMADQASALRSDVALSLTARFTSNGAARIVRASPALEAAFGYEPDELAGKPLAILHGGRTTPEHIAESWRVVEKGTRSSGGTLLAKKSGELVYGEWEMSRVDDPEHGPLLLLCGNIIERRKRPSAAAPADTSKLLADTIDAIALLAHDIRGPLNTVIGYADLIAESPEVTSEIKDHVGMIVRAANRVVDMTNEIMLASRLDRNEYAPFIERFELLSLIESTIALLPGAERVELDVADATIEMEGDLAAVRHIIANLVGNALKYSARETRVFVVVTHDSAHVRLHVIDQGIGIPANEIKLVFDRFTRASNARNSNVRGTGLGLYFVKQLVERSGGSIGLSSRAGHGTEVTVTLPLQAMV